MLMNTLAIRKKWDTGTCPSLRWKTGHKQVKNLLTVFDPCGRVQPETDLLELWRLDGSRLTLRVDGGGKERKRRKVWKPERTGRFREIRSQLIGKEKRIKQKYRAPNNSRDQGKQEERKLLVNNTGGLRQCSTCA